MGRRVARTRNLGTLTDAEYFSKIRSALRKTFQYWKPMQEAKKNVRRLSSSKAKGEKWEYQCNSCELWHFKVEIDHIIPAGSLRCLEDIAGFIDRLTNEDVNMYQVLCKPCHRQKTNKERK